MQVLLVVDAQNEFSPAGQRAVPNHEDAAREILAHVARARADGRPIAWIQHFNKPDESSAFVPGTWGAQLSPGMGALSGSSLEQHFTKNVFGAFNGTGLEEWLAEFDVTSVMVTGFYAHMCVSTSIREALIRGYDVVVDPAATGARDLIDPILGTQSAEEVRRTALLQVVNMGATLYMPHAAAESRFAEAAR